MKSSHDGYRDRWSQPTNLDDYANYVKTITGRYKGVIDAYEIWNEPWLSKLFWHTRFEDGHKAGPDPQGDYARLMQAGYKAAKAVDPSIKIAGINTTTHKAEKDIIDGSDWTRGVIEKGGLEACDILSYHHYMGANAAFPGDEVEQGFQKAFSPLLVKTKTLPKPVWMSEGSSLYGMSKSQGFYRHSLPVPNTENNTVIADQLCRYVVSMMAQGSRKVFLYSMATPGSEWAVLVTANGSMHPAGAATRTWRGSWKIPNLSSALPWATTLSLIFSAVPGAPLRCWLPEQAAPTQFPAAPILHAPTCGATLYWWAPSWAALYRMFPSPVQQKPWRKCCLRLLNKPSNDWEATCRHS
jgi:hypothetical protein